MSLPGYNRGDSGPHGTLATTTNPSGASGHAKRLDPDAVRETGSAR